MAIEGLIRDGEVLIRHVRNAENPFGYSLQLLEPDFLDEEFCTQNPDNGNCIVMGVELNRFNKAVAFWIFEGPNHPYDDQSYGLNKPGRTRVPAEDMLHLYQPLSEASKQGVFQCLPV